MPEAAALCYELTLPRSHALVIFAGGLLPSLDPKPEQGALLVVSFLGSLVHSPNLFLISWLVSNRHKDGKDEQERNLHALRWKVRVETGVVTRAHQRMIVFASRTLSLFSHPAHFYCLTLIDALNVVVEKISSAVA